jgi:acyl carrier protein
MDVVISLEETFEVAIPDDLGQRVKTMRDIVDYIAGRLASGEARSDAGQSAGAIG